MFSAIGSKVNNTLAKFTRGGTESADVDHAGAGVGPPFAPQCAPAVANDGFRVGDEVEYFSKSKRRWSPAKVIKRRRDGLYDLDCRAAVAETSIRALPRIAPPAEVDSAGNEVAAEVPAKVQLPGNAVAAEVPHDACRVAEQQAPSNSASSDGPEVEHAAPSGAQKLEEGRPSPNTGFPIGADVEYFSQSQQIWVRAKVLGRRSDGLYNLNCRAGVSENSIRAIPRIPPATEALPAEHAVAIAVLRDSGTDGQGHPSPNDAIPKGAEVEYLSVSKNTWVAARVIRLRSDGLYDLDCKAGVPKTSIRVLSSTSHAVAALPASVVAVPEMTSDPRVGGKDQITPRFTFTVGADVEYLSQSQNKWVPARVIGHRGDGLYDLDRRAGVPEANIRSLRQVVLAVAARPATCEKADGNTGGAALTSPADAKPQPAAPHPCPAVPLAPDSAICVGSADTIGPRPTMDAFVFHRHFGGEAESSFLAVYDGHKGRECAEIAARELHTI